MSTYRNTQPVEDDPTLQFTDRWWIAQFDSVIEENAREWRGRGGHATRFCADVSGNTVEELIKMALAIGPTADAGVGT